MLIRCINGNSLKQVQRKILRQVEVQLVDSCVLGMTKNLDRTHSVRADAYRDAARRCPEARSI